MNGTTEPRFASALSTAGETRRAVEQVGERIRADLGDAAPDLVAAFVSHHHGGEIESLGPELARRLGAGALIGCTGESIIGEGREVEQGPALSAWAACLPETRVRPFACEARPPAEGEEERPRFSALPEVRDHARASLLLVADPFSFPMDAFLEHLNESLPGVPAVGGMASGGMGPGQNLLFDARGLRPGGALGVVLEGAIEVRSVVSQGCRPVGVPWVVTDGEQNVIKKLGGRPAFDVLMETMQKLGPEDRKLFQRAPFVGLAIDPTKSRFERGDFLVRGIVGASQKEKVIAVADTVRRGQSLQFLVRDAASASEDLALLMGAERQRGPAAAGARSAPAASTGALLFSCNGRGTRMFDRPDHDVSAVSAGLDGAAPVAGFFAMGEIGPVGGRNFLHGFTASVALFRRRREAAP
jgi:small ligand-binding sensory domain FIST